MTIDLALYSTIKDKVCISYLGNCDEYLYQLVYFRETIEQSLKGIEVFLCSRDISFHHIKNNKKVISFSELKQQKLNYGKIFEISSNATCHPVEKFLEESDIKIVPSEINLPLENKKCLIVTKGNWPTTDLSDVNTKKLVNLCESYGLFPELEGTIEDVGHVWGIESWQLWKHAELYQKNCLLVPNSTGTNFYKKTFPKMKIIKDFDI